MHVGWFQPARDWVVVDQIPATVRIMGDHTDNLTVVIGIDESGACGWLVAHDRAGHNHHEILAFRNGCVGGQAGDGRLWVGCVFNDGGCDLCFGSCGGRADAQTFTPEK